MASARSSSSLQIDGGPPGWLTCPKSCLLCLPLLVSTQSARSSRIAPELRKISEDRPTEAGLYFKEELESLLTALDGRVWGLGEGDPWLSPAGGLYQHLVGDHTFFVLRNKELLSHL